MSDSTIDDALKLLETGRGNPDRLKKIIQSFQKRSLISLEDRKYVEALVSQYLTPRHRIKIKKIEPVKKQPSITPRTLKSTKPEFNFEKNDNTSSEKTDPEKSESSNLTEQICLKCGYHNSGENNFCNRCGVRITKPETHTTQPEPSGGGINEGDI